MSIKGIIFDFDGTLFDSMSIWETAGMDYLKSLGVIAEEGLSEKLKRLSLKQSAKYLQEKYNLSLSIEQIMNGINKTIEEFYFYQAMPKANVISTLSLFQSKGIKMCIVTATDKYLVEAALKHCEMMKYFENIITCSEVGYDKNEPYIFELACETIGTNKAEMVVFEDAYHAAKTAKQAGFYVVGIYDQYEPKTIALKEIVDLYINSFSEVGNLLKI